MVGVAAAIAIPVYLGVSHSYHVNKDLGPCPGKLGRWPQLLRIERSGSPPFPHSLGRI
jgi:hypothetical protein